MLARVFAPQYTRLERVGFIRSAGILANLKDNIEFEARHVLEMLKISVAMENLML